ncbi:MAG: isocitrate/isopropylmalate family dehydrogenase, partial [Patescibacteria group bacterium]
GKGIANPTAQILSLAMLLRHTFDLQKEADAIESAVFACLLADERTKDLMPSGENGLSTTDFTNAVIDKLQR